MTVPAGNGILSTIKIVGTMRRDYDETKIIKKDF